MFLTPDEIKHTPSGNHHNKYIIATLVAIVGISISAGISYMLYSQQLEIAELKKQMQQSLDNKQISTVNFNSQLSATNDKLSKLTKTVNNFWKTADKATRLQRSVNKINITLKQQKQLNSSLENKISNITRTQANYSQLLENKIMKHINKNKQQLEKQITYNKKSITALTRQNSNHTIDIKKISSKMAELSDDMDENIEKINAINQDRKTINHKILQIEQKNNNSAN